MAGSPDLECNSQVPAASFSCGGSFLLQVKILNGDEALND
jgi:hypothetical protein